MDSRGEGESAPCDRSNRAHSHDNDGEVNVTVEEGEQAAVADVYAGDAASTQRPDEGVRTVFLFVIEADPDPDVLARVAMIFNIAHVAPRSVKFQRESTGNATIVVAIPLLGGVQADMIRRKLEQLTCTLSVSLSETG